LTCCHKLRHTRYSASRSWASAAASRTPASPVDQAPKDLASVVDIGLFDQAGVDPAVANQPAAEQNVGVDILVHPLAHRGQAPGLDIGIIWGVLIRWHGRVEPQVGGRLDLDLPRGGGEVCFLRGICGHVDVPGQVVPEHLFRPVVLVVVGFDQLVQGLREALVGQVAAIGQPTVPRDSE